MKARQRPAWLPPDYVERAFSEVPLGTEFLMNGRKLAKLGEFRTCACACGHEHAPTNSISDGNLYTIAAASRVWVAP